VIRIRLARKPKANSAGNEDAAASAAGGTERYFHLHHVAHERGSFRTGSRPGRLVPARGAGRGLWRLRMDVGVGARDLNGPALQTHLPIPLRPDRAETPA